MRRSRIDFVTISPLLLLVFLPVGAFINSYFTKTAAHPEVTFIKYFAIPLLGFSLGSILFLGIVRNDWKMPDRWLSFIDGHLGSIVFIISGLFLICFSTLAILRYTSLHTTVFDMGLYDHKIWSISIASEASIFYESAIGHFQPILIFYGLIYRIYDSPVVIQIMQAVAMISGIIPLYLISKRYLDNKLIILLIAIAYLLYSPVGFNASLDFHPDHLYAPLILWAFYFAEEENYIKAVIFAALGAMIKEPLILGSAFFGLYLVLSKRQYKIGILSFLSFLVLFFVVVYIILPYTNEQLAFQGGAFPILENNNEAGGIIVRMRVLIDVLLMWKVRKALFIYFLLTPLLFLPLLEWKRFLPALPLMAIPLFSVTYLHSAVDSQYTAGIIAPAFVALVFLLKRIESNYSLKHVAALATFITVMTLTFHIAHGSSLISINFWKTGWAEIWHHSNYTSGEHKKILQEAIYRIPEDRNIIVVVQGNINNARLAHRYIYALFSGSAVSSLHRWEGVVADADYILLDMNRPLLVGDRVDTEVYMQELQNIKNNSVFHIDFEKDGVLLFKRTMKGTTS